MMKIKRIGVEMQSHPSAKFTDSPSMLRLVQVSESEYTNEFLARRPFLEEHDIINHSLHPHNTLPGATNTKCNIKGAALLMSCCQTSSESNSNTHICQVLSAKQVWDLLMALEHKTDTVELSLCDTIPVFDINLHQTAGGWIADRKPFSNGRQINMTEFPALSNGGV